jgi:hypothetical protein
MPAAGFLTGGGTLIYNGVTFPSQISSSVSITPIFDTSGRVRKFNHYTLTVTAVFHNLMHASSAEGPITSSLDGGMPTLISKLTEPGRKLTFTGKGLGSLFVINTTKHDVAFGPIPKIDAIEFIGSNQAVRITWTCEVRLSCVDNPQNRILELSYEMNWEIADNGLTVRVVTGRLEIAAHRVGDGNTATRLPTDTVNRYRKFIQVAMPDGYKRRRSYVMSPDKRVLHFTIIDEEIPSNNPYFPGIFQPDLTYSVTNGSQGFTTWHAQLAGRIEVAHGMPRWLSWLCFITVAQSKLKAAERAVAPADAGNRKGIVVPTGFSFQEEIYGLGTSFSLSWNLVTTWASLMKAAGLWAPLNTNTWEAWKQSMSNQWSEDAVSKQVHAHTTSEDYMNDVCDAPRQVTVGQQMYRPAGDPNFPELATKCPTAANSWIAFQPEVLESRDTKTVFHHTLRKPEPYSPADTSPSDENYRNPGGETLPPVVQRRSQSGYQVVFRGYAMRAGFTIPKFELTEFGGVKVRPIDPQRFKSRVVAQTTCPIHAAAWELYYVCMGTPKDNSYKIKAAKFQ